MFLKRGDPGQGLTVDYYTKDGDQEQSDFDIGFTMIFCALKLPEPNQRLTLDDAIWS